MSTLAGVIGGSRKELRWIAVTGAMVLIVAAITVPNLLQTRPATKSSEGLIADYPQTTRTAGKDVAAPMETYTITARLAPEAAKESIVQDRKIIRTSSLEMVVQQTAEVTDKITALAEHLGGYLVSADGGGQNASRGALTIRVPADRFEEARAEIRQLALRIESEKVQAQDVTRQYVDQDASLRNLRAEEAQYLAILKQAGTVKDLLAVSEKLSEVRGQIEQQQAEFDALSKQTETVSIAISLRTETETQVFGLNWRPLYQLKLALRDGLDSVASYGTAMITILFYLPAVLLWTVTILASIIIGWRTVRWIGRRWFGWTMMQSSVR